MKQVKDDAKISFWCSNNIKVKDILFRKTSVDLGITRVIGYDRA